jgi:Domain of unknown function (DUF4188)
VKTNVDLRTVDLSAYPDLVVIYLGMRVRTFPGIKTLLGLGPQIDAAGAGRPDGLLHYENNIVFRLYPLHLGMRWYWRDFGSMERWTRSEPHRQWWQRFMHDSGGTGFWHEVYFDAGRDGRRLCRFETSSRFSGLCPAAAGAWRHVLRASAPPARGRDAGAAIGCCRKRSRLGLASALICLY